MQIRLFLKSKRAELMRFILFAAFFAASFFLYHLPIKAVIYPTVLILMFLLINLIVDYIKMSMKHNELIKIREFSDITYTSFPIEENCDDSDYQEIIRMLSEQQKKLECDMNQKYCDMIEYYTVWAHQIKTPISSMKLHLQNEDSPLSRKLSADLLRIEQYVDMVLMFLRLDSSSTDYVFKEYRIDDIVRQAVKKFAGEFINRKLNLKYNSLNTTVVTDEKWLSFVIEQILSNALKYTQTGGVEIFMENPAILCIRDSGIGIASEDLPRIFEKGYTGYNGRSDKKASGIGLYLCKRICVNLGITITAESVIDCGTTIRLDLTQNKQSF